MINPLVSAVIAIISVIISSYSLYKTLKTPVLLEEYANKTLNTLDETLKETLDPIQKNISRSYSQLGKQGASVRQKQALDARITQDVINMQDPLIQGALDLFPNVKEYVTKNPHMLMELLPRLQMLQQTEGFKLGDLIGKNPSPSLGTHPHPFGLNEE